MSKVCFFQTSEFSKATTFGRKGFWVVFHQSGGLQNEQSLSFWIFSSSFKTFKIPNFCQKRSLSSFSAHILSFWIFQALNFKRPYFCQKMSLSSFSPSGRLTQWSKFAFLRLSILKVSKTFNLTKEVFEYFLTNRAAYKMSKVWFSEFFKF